MKNSLTRLSRQGLTHSLLLARLLVSGLWPASVQPALPILLAGLTLSTAAQAQQKTPLAKPVPQLMWIRNFQENEEVIYEVTQTSFTVEWDNVIYAGHYEATATPIDSQGVVGTPVSVRPIAPVKGVTESGVIKKNYEAVFKGLTANMIYTVLIKAIASGYLYTFTQSGERVRKSDRYTDSEASITVTTLPMKSTLPAPTVTLEVGDTQLTANWEAVANAASYELQWKASSVTS